MVRTPHLGAEMSGVGAPSLTPHPGALDAMLGDNFGRTQTSIVYHNCLAELVVLVVVLASSFSCGPGSDAGISDPWATLLRRQRRENSRQQRETPNESPCAMGLAHHIPHSWQHSRCGCTSKALCKRPLECTCDAWLGGGLRPRRACCRCFTGAGR